MTAEILPYLVQCFQLFRDALSSEATEAEGENGNVLNTEQEAQKEWYKYTLAQLRAFARKYHAAAASLVEILENDVFAEGKVHQSIRDSVILSLHP